MPAENQKRNVVIVAAAVKRVQVKISFAWAEKTVEALKIYVIYNNKNGT